MHNFSLFFFFCFSQAEKELGEYRVREKRRELVKMRVIKKQKKWKEEGEMEEDE